MRSAVATAVVALLATATLVGPAAGEPAPAPGELWSNFPLEQPADSRPPRTSRPVEPADSGPPPTSQPVSPPRPVSTVPVDASEESSTTGVLLGLGAAAAVAAAAGGALVYGRRRRTPSATSEQDGSEPVAIKVARPIGRATPRVATGGGRSVAVAEPSARVAAPRAEPATRVAAPRAEPSLFEVLSPRLRLEEDVEEAAARVGASAPLAGEIQWWRGYLKSHFFVEVDPPLDQPIESQAFRASGDDAPEQNDVAVEAHKGLVEWLVAAGWERDGRGEHWFSDRFRKD
ncbi:MAG: hypothetical protein MSC30_08395 [Gaiellaceae bacterium MAG52_C11]|nr:hypothetical protein [Candidatus Gaiellasilicea maunaloa]